MSRRSRTAIGVLVVIVLAVMTQVGVPTTFSVLAETQVVSLTLADDFRHLWFFRNATLTVTGADGSRQSRSFSGSLRPAPGTKVTLVRTGSGPLVVTIEAGKNSPVAELDEGEIVNGRLDLVDGPADGERAGEPATVLPVSGTITIGAEVNNGFAERPVMLLAGSVTMLAHALLGSLRYDAGHVQLDPGDLVTLKGLGNAYGLVTASDANLSTVMRMDAWRLLVTRYGSEGYSFYASPIARIMNDPVIQAVWAGAVFLFAVLAKLRPTQEERHGRSR